VSCEGSMIKDACGCRSMVSSAALLPNGERSCAPVRIYGEQRYVLGYVPTGGLHGIKPSDRVTIETGLRTAEGIVARVDPIAAALPWRRSQVRAGLAAGSKLDSSSRSPGHGELGCRVILLGCVGGVGALETSRPAGRRANKSGARVDAIGVSAREAPPLRRRMEALLSYITGPIFGEPS